MKREDMIIRSVEMTAGDERCYVYYNAEITGFTRDADIVSLALTDNEGYSFYAEIEDFRPALIVDPDLFGDTIYTKLKKPETVLSGKDWTITARRDEVRKQLMKWLDIRCRKHLVQFVGDYPIYTFTALIDLITNGAPGTALPMDMISPTVIDLNTQIATQTSIIEDGEERKVYEGLYDNFVPVQYSLSTDRKVLSDFFSKIDESGFDGLDKAKYIRNIHRSIWGLKE